MRDFTPGDDLPLRHHPVFQPPFVNSARTSILRSLPVNTLAEEAPDESVAAYREGPRIVRCIDAPRFPRLMSARFYEHCSISRTAGPVGSGLAKAATQSPPPTGGRSRTRMKHFVGAGHTGSHAHRHHRDTHRTPGRHTVTRIPPFRTVRQPPCPTPTETRFPATSLCPSPDGGTCTKTGDLTCPRSAPG